MNDRESLRHDGAERPPLGQRLAEIGRVVCSGLAKAVELSGMAAVGHTFVPPAIYEQQAIERGIDQLEQYANNQR